MCIILYLLFFNDRITLNIRVTDTTTTTLTTLDSLPVDIFVKILTFFVNDIQCCNLKCLLGLMYISKGMYTRIYEETPIILRNHSVFLNDLLAVYVKKSMAAKEVVEAAVARVNAAEVVMDVVAAAATAATAAEVRASATMVDAWQLAEDWRLMPAWPQRLKVAATATAAAAAAVAAEWLAEDATEDAEEAAEEAEEAAAVAVRAQLSAAEDVRAVKARVERLRFFGLQM